MISYSQVVVYKCRATFNVPLLGSAQTRIWGVNPANSVRNRRKVADRTVSSVTRPLMFISWGISCNESGSFYGFRPGKISLYSRLWSCFTSKPSVQVHRRWSLFKSTVQQNALIPSNSTLPELIFILERLSESEVDSLLPVYDPSTMSPSPHVDPRLRDQSVSHPSSPGTPAFPSVIKLFRDTSVWALYSPPSAFPSSPFYNASLRFPLLLRPCTR